MTNKLTLAAVAFASFAAPAVAATAFDLEGVATGNYPGSLTVVDGGVTLTITPEGFPGGSLQVGDPGIPLLGSRGVVGSQLPSSIDFDRFAPLRFSFSQNVAAITFNFGDGGGDDDSPVTIYAYDAGNALLGSVVGSYPAGQTNGSSASLSFANSRYFIAESTPGVNNHSLFWDIGSVRFGAVPEPATWTMLIAGFGLAGAATRRRSAAATRALA